MFPVSIEGTGLINYTLHLVLPAFANTQKKNYRIAVYEASNTGNK